MSFPVVFAFWPLISFFLASRAFIFFHFGFLAAARPPSHTLPGRPLKIGLLGRRFLSIWPLGPSFPCVFVFLAVIVLCCVFKASFWHLGQPKHDRYSATRCNVSYRVLTFALPPCFVCLVLSGKKKTFPPRSLHAGLHGFELYVPCRRRRRRSHLPDDKRKNDATDATKKPKRRNPSEVASTQQTTLTETVPTGVLQDEEDEEASCQQVAPTNGFDTHAAIQHLPRKVTPTNGFDTHAAIHTCLQDEDEENEDVATCRDNLFGTRHFQQKGHPQPPWALRTRSKRRKPASRRRRRR